MEDSLEEVSKQNTLSEEVTNKRTLSREEDVAHRRGWKTRSAEDVWLGEDWQCLRLRRLSQSVASSGTVSTCAMVTRVS